jgi:hypothetical protein
LRRYQVSADLDHGMVAIDRELAAAGNELCLAVHDNKAGLGAVGEAVGR